MDNFSVRSEHNFHNLVVKPNHMHLLDKPNGYASALVKNSLSHQMRFTVQKLEEKLCAAGIHMCCRISCSETARVSRLAGSCLPTARALRTDPAPLPASASARVQRYFWTCVEMPCMRPSCVSGARGSMSC